MPLLPWLAIPTAVTWTVLSSRTSRTVAVGALVFTAFATAALVMVDDGRLAFSTREEYARWLSG